MNINYNKISLTGLGRKGREGKRDCIGSSNDTETCTRWTCLNADLVSMLLLPLLSANNTFKKHIIFVDAKMDSTSTLL